MNKKLKEKRQIGKWRSWETTEGVIRAPHRSMMRAMGLTDDDINAPFIGVASTHNEVTPCNLTGPELSEHAKVGVNGPDSAGLIFSTIAVSDGISMGHEGMRASLVSREVIADSVELVMHAERFDGMVTIAGCDKSLPGMLMASARINRPAIFLYGGSSLPGVYKGKDISIVDVFEGIGAFEKGIISEEELYEIECNACPGQGSCAGMFTANTMSSAFEAMGMSLPFSSTMANEDEEKVTKISSIIAILGAVNVPVIKFSVDWWSTLHQSSSVKILSTTTIHTSMLIPLAIMTAAFTLFSILIFLMKYNTELIKIKNKGLDRL